MDAATCYGFDRRGIGARYAAGVPQVRLVHLSEFPHEHPRTQDVLSNAATQSRIRSPLPPRSPQQRKLRAHQGANVAGMTCLIRSLRRGEACGGT